MPRVAVIDRLSDRWAARRKERDRSRRLRRYEHAGRGTVVLKVVACVLLFAAFTLLGFLVGSDQYQVTFIGWVPCIMLVCGIGLGALYLVVLRRSIGFEEQLSLPECQRDSDVVFTMRFKNKSPLLMLR